MTGSFIVMENIQGALIQQPKLLSPAGQACLCPSPFKKDLPKKNFLIGCPGLARLPSSTSHLFASQGFASWYSVKEFQQYCHWFQGNIPIKGQCNFNKEKNEVYSEVKYIFQSNLARFNIFSIPNCNVQYKKKSDLTFILKLTLFNLSSYIVKPQ